MAKLVNSNHIPFVVLLFIAFGFQAYGVPYDDSITTDCLSTPLSAHYGGGMVVNPELNEGLNGWTAFGDAKIAHAASEDGNKFIVAYERKRPSHSFAQTFNLEKDKLYTFSAWVQMSDGKADVAAVFKTKTRYEVAGWAPANKSCWTMLKGGLAPKTSGPAHLYFETEGKADVWADSISLQSFTHQEWESHQQERIKKVRQQKLRIQVVDRNGQPIPNAKVSLKQTRRKFPFGCAINKNILYNPKYQSWFLHRFNYATFENELKWYSTESKRGVEDYRIPDCMIKFLETNGIGARAHNLLWEDQKYQPYWVPGLSQSELWKAVRKRMKSVVRRYEGKFIQWDVMNENLHSSFFESRLNYNAASTYFYDHVHKLDPRATPCLNDFNTIEEPTDSQSSPYKYKNKIDEMRAQGYKGRLVIGLEGHFSYDRVNLPYIRASIEYLTTSLKLPIWITELDLTDGPNRAQLLDQIIRELYAHKYVRGIVLWASLSDSGCYRMCLTDYKYNNLDTGNVVDQFIKELKHKDVLDSPATTDSNGFFEASLYHGDYQVQAIHSNGTQVSKLIQVAPSRKRKTTTTTRIHRLTLDV
ncbi:endo-1 4-beta-xylanase a [Phtheirospermum japonicum]|uniref:Endo-1 4-beta-xylanase a n=1 Tax=Phtheirospermum japonicum TaxID=374723 RepID=A0A830D5H3_9LAMI|nr:endo-1 4-beta-xylanase a [Phtheirospermum japonicum]